MDQGWIIRNEDKQSCHSCMRDFALTCSVILPSVIIIFLTASELCSINELKIWIRGGNSKNVDKQSCLLACDTQN